MAEVARQLALGPTAQALRIALAFALVQDVDEQAWVFNHAFALRMLRALVMVEPGAQLARGQPLRIQAGQQPHRVIAVGARQRGEHAHRRASRSDSRRAGRAHSSPQ